MRRKQPVTPQRRSEPRQHKPADGGPAEGGFSAFTSSDDRSAGRSAQGPTGPERSGPTVSVSAPPKATPRPDARPLKSGRYDFMSPLNWRVPTRLVAILLIPVLIGLVFGGLRVNTSFDEYTKADRAVKTAELANAATELADALESERDLSAIPLLTGSDDQGVVPKLREATDKALANYNAAYARISDDPNLRRRNAAFQQMVVFLPHLRASAYGKELFASATQAAYSTLFAPLLAVDNSVGFGSTDVTSKGRAIYAISLAKASASTQRVLMLNLLVGIGLERNTRHENTELIQSLLVASKLEQVGFNEFATGSTQSDNQAYARAQVAQDAADQRAPLRMPDGKTMPSIPGLMTIAFGYAEAAMAGEQNGPDAARRLFANSQKEGLTAANWLQATHGHMTALRNTESQLLGQVVSEAQDLKSRAQTDAVLNSAIVIAALALAGLLTGFIARSMILGMRTLNTAALEIANHRLPDLVERLSKTDPERVDTTVAPIPLWGKDEIGEVARAFDQVHSQAVSLAAEQALLRGNVNAIFTNLSRRSQSLIQRQLALITDLENNEADPDQLENLFKLDHLATRMRRNGENLLVLSGEEPGRRWNTPVPLVDVLRAAASEVEQYERIELAGIPEAEVVGPAVTDLVHLLAELLENATSFSSPQTRVLVNATRLPDGRVLVEIHDKGIGLTAEDFAEINEKLAEPPTVDATISRRMGLFVVGRLSQRHDIRVQLRPSGESAGTTSLVMLPQQLTQAGHAPEPEEEQFTVSRIFAEQEPSPWQIEDRPRSAAELGFDDHLTGRTGSGSGFSPALESMERSQRLEQRRRTAALEPAAEAADGYDAGLFQPSPFAAGPAEPVDAELIESELLDSGHHDGYADAPQEPVQDAYSARRHQEEYEDPYWRQTYGQEGYGAAQEPYAPAGYQERTHPDSPYAPAGYAEAGYPDAGYPDHQDGYGRQEFAPDSYGYQDYADNGYDQGYRPGHQAEQGGTDHGYGRPEPQALPPALPTGGQSTFGQSTFGQSSFGQSTLGSGLPQRRPGQQLAGGGLPAQNGSASGSPGGEKLNWFTGARETDNTAAAESRGHEVSALGGYGPTGPTNSPRAWQSANDGDWQRAEQVREPVSNGLTASGLPRRVPKQNLVSGNAKPGPADGPQVSRNPEEVRGRLTNLRRGVEQGRSAGGDPGATGSFRIDPNPGRSDNGQHNTSTDLFGGSNHQER